MNDLGNRVGVDAIETGVAGGAGIIPLGDTEGAMQRVGKVRVASDIF